LIAAPEPTYDGLTVYPVCFWKMGISTSISPVSRVLVVLAIRIVGLAGLEVITGTVVVGEVVVAVVVVIVDVVVFVVVDDTAGVEVVLVELEVVWEVVWVVDVEDVVDVEEHPAAGKDRIIINAAVIK